MVMGMRVMPMMVMMKMTMVVGRGSHLSVTRQNDKHKGKEEGHSLYVL